ncbi:PilZ domain-containing protein [Sporobacter termitidis DSM 10068]|uniref:PilZ domain-containing protein n=1 Tax=Sporobacter termitidis DSM 10068 TaxID=1123282 RepID=A0A1M5Y394_9FIRM|nr:PilZ domain-containing protein [Sporobacter termitidis]SHI06565.1 PilZ domain-containing protein [Sporobacter termitidis DSM 10068]
MYLKCDAMIYLADQIEAPVFCRIIKLDTDRREAWVRVEENRILRDKDTVSIQTYDDAKGMLFYQGMVCEASVHKLAIKKLRLVDERQRRDDVRVKVNIPLLLNEIYIGTKIRKLDKGARFEVINVSAGGMLLKSRLDIAEENACLIFDFPLETKHLNCRAQIVRKQAENDYYLYGCQLLNNESDKRELRRFVFKTQLKTRRTALR